MTRRPDNRGRTDVLAAFERFWKAYPRRPDNPKAAARQVFERRVREGADPDAIVRAAAVFAARVVDRKLGDIFIPHARTWLSQRRWEDYLDDGEPEPAPDPHAGHPLVWMRDEIGDAPWLSWIAPLEVDPGDPPTLRARLRVSLDHARERWGPLIDAHYGQPVRWTLQRKD